MAKQDRDEKETLGDNWDTDASASDNESYELEMMQKDSFKAQNTQKANSTEK